MWTDAHCHLDSIGEAGPGAIEAAIRRAADAGVDRLVTIGTDLASSRAAVTIAGEHPGVWAAVGVHPHDAGSLDSATFAAIRDLAGGQRVVAIGEIGLDYYRDLSPREDQQDAFRRQLALASELDLAVVIHMRDAHQDVFQILAETGPPQRLVFHCFSGGADDARAALALGGYVSFAGNVSYKSAASLREAAAVVPADRLLVETDSPYLAPVPHRGRPNEPALVAVVGAFLAETLGRPVADIAASTAANAARVFRLPAEGAVPAG